MSAFLTLCDITHMLLRLRLLRPSGCRSRAITSTVRSATMGPVGRKRSRGEIDPARDIDLVETELLLNDLMLVRWVVRK